jgi:thiamine pyrophosphate-dependent acetolactate synthase large subunit-like protein
MAFFVFGPLSYEEKPMTKQMMTGAEILLECLAREGVECIFGYPGGATLPLYDALYDHGIRHVLMRHEENACFAAEGYAQGEGPFSSTNHCSSR